VARASVRRVAGVAEAGRERYSERDRGLSSAVSMTGGMLRHGRDGSAARARDEVERKAGMKGIGGVAGKEVSSPPPSSQSSPAVVRGRFCSLLHLALPQERWWQAP